MHIDENEYNQMLAIAIIPYQKYGEKYSLGEALKRGTLFPALYRPYDPEKEGWMKNE